MVSVLQTHPAVRKVQLVGSRAEGHATERSDWDFRITTSDFGLLARDLPTLFAPLRPLAQQWDRFGTYRNWMLVLPGPVKIELLFPDQPQERPSPWLVAAETLAAIDYQFWDWALWASGKAAVGKSDVVADEIQMLFEHLLTPLGARQPPRSVSEAIDVYEALRARAEARFNVKVSRRLEKEVTRVLRSAPTHNA